MRNEDECFWYLIVWKRESSLLFFLFWKIYLDLTTNDKDPASCKLYFSFPAIRQQTNLSFQLNSIAFFIVFHRRRTIHWVSGNFCNKLKLSGGGRRRERNVQFTLCQDRAESAEWDVSSENKIENTTERGRGDLVLIKFSSKVNFLWTFHFSARPSVCVWVCFCQDLSKP